MLVEAQLMRNMYCVESVCIRSFSGPYFPAFALDTERSEYSVRMRENMGQSNSEYGHFHAVMHSVNSGCIRSFSGPYFLAFG